MMRGNLVRIGMFAFAVALGFSAGAKEKNAPSEDADDAILVPTFHCLGIYWSPPEGGAEHEVQVQYRVKGEKQWLSGLPLLYRPIDTPECKGDYRGSLVNLTPGTSYEVALTVEGSGRRIECRGSTWSEEFVVQSVEKVSDRKTTLEVTKSGKPGAYVLYDGTGCTIDTGNADDLGIAVNASYVILRGFTIKNVNQHGIRILDGHHVVIEDCDISQWGSESEKGWGENYQAGVFSSDKELSAVVVQRCKIHHPSWDSNSWAEKHGDSSHPKGPQTVVFFESPGNHVIRYNECWSDADHYFNDGMGAGRNGSYRGFPGADSDIYGNYIANCWDDGLEVEGGGQNVRIWNNYVEEVLMPIANAAVSIGPLYVWRNISGRSYTPKGSRTNSTHGAFAKMGHSGSDEWMTGHMYFFNNTIFQNGDDGADGLGGDNRIIKHCTTRNNIFHVRETDDRSIAVTKDHSDNDFDYDFTSAGFPDDHEKHGVVGVPTYLKAAGFDAKTRTGVFQLAPGSKGVDAGVVIPNFCEEVDGQRPDLGAHESGTGQMVFGVKAEFVALRD